MGAAEVEASLSRCLRDLPHFYSYRYTEDAARVLRKNLCQALVLNDPHKLHLLFPLVQPDDPSISWSLRAAQGAVEGAEYTEAARGHPCGHIFTHGESSYHCRTCAADDTCVLCARCFAESDHEGHAVFVSVSPGNSGCCDCGDDEAWNSPVDCGIHKAHYGKGKASEGPEPSSLSPEITESIRRTIGKAIDYLCDVFSCSPEQLRLPKTDISITMQERLSRLNPEKYAGPEPVREPVEYALVLWNDEKHTYDQVQDQVARATRKSRSHGKREAQKVDTVGRSVLEYSSEIHRLLGMAKILEEINVSVTIRSSRDTFRELMCETIISWLADISGCRVGSDAHVLRRTICAEMFSPWKVRSLKNHAIVGHSGIYDHESENDFWERNAPFALFRQAAANANVTIVDAMTNEEEEDDETAEEIDEVDMTGADAEDDPMDDAASDEAEDVQQTRNTTQTGAFNRLLRILSANPAAVLAAGPAAVGDTVEDEQTERETGVAQDMLAASTSDPSIEARDSDVEMGEASDTPAPRESLVRRTSRQASIAESQAEESDDGATVVGPVSAIPPVPKTPRGKRIRDKSRPPPHWREKPDGWVDYAKRPSAENPSLRLRIDMLILYDLRLWKTLRDTLRHLYITTVITEPDFKRLLGIRFAGLYTLLAQLYLIADREPDHSIINLSLQLLTTPSITAEVVERGCFLTNLIAILYTFLTTRQVGYPKDIQATANLALDAGVLTNRRMFHFFVDARYIFQSVSVQHCLRSEPLYLLQYLDLVRLHQGICPNVRAVGEHIEYEPDTWLNASLILKEVNRLSRLVMESFLIIDESDEINKQQIIRALKLLCQTTIHNALGFDWARFRHSEPKSMMRFLTIPALSGSGTFFVPSGRVLNSPMSFHHPLHYITSWGLQASKSMTRDQLRMELLSTLDIQNLATKHCERDEGLDGPIPAHTLMTAMFDSSIKMCAWLSQMRAGMWVRNGMTLRHQMHNYRSPTQRDITYQRDIFMCQAGLVLVGQEGSHIGEEFFVQMLHRFDLDSWLVRKTDMKEEYDATQYLDVAEDFILLLIILLTEREDLLPVQGAGKASDRAIRRDIAHVLCFKPLSHSDLTNRLTERISESSNFDAILEDMTIYKGPEGLSDTGTFELKSEYFDIIEPYYAFYNRNQREEADSIYRQKMSKKLKIQAIDVVPEVQLPVISSGLFQHLSAFTRSKSFIVVIEESLEFITSLQRSSLVVESTKLEPLLHLLLHLILLAVNEDIATGIAESDGNGFIDRMVVASNPSWSATIGHLRHILVANTYPSCHSRARLIIKRAQEARPALFASHNMLDQEIRSIPTPNSEIDKEAKKRAALERQAKVMASFKTQQSNFMTEQGLNWDVDDFSDEEHADSKHNAAEAPSSENLRPYPSDACILCQEEANDEKLFGTFVFISATNIMRQTPVHDRDYVNEVLATPENLDRSADAIRPFGVASQNKIVLKKVGKDGDIVKQASQGLAKGFTHHESVREGHVVTGCGHMMHYSCFETYLAATERRHQTQISRLHPERLEKKQFICPLCKALGNAFLPVIWKPRQESYPGFLSSTTVEDFDDWLEHHFSFFQGLLMDTSVVGDFSTEARSETAQRYIDTKLRESISHAITIPGLSIDLQMRMEAIRRVAASTNAQDFIQLMNAQAPGLQETLPAIDLARAYNALNTSFIINTEAPGVGSLPAPGDQPQLSMKWAVQMIASTITAAEIQSRGVNSATCLLDAISEQALTNLRILCESITAMQTLEELNPDVPKADRRAHELLALSHLFAVPDHEQNIRSPSPIRMNIFETLVTCAYMPSEMWQTHGSGLVHLALLAEVIKTIHVYHDCDVPLESFDIEGAEEDPRFTSFLHSMDQIYQKATGSQLMPFSGESGTSVFLQRVVERQCLIFLRKVLILTHVHSAIDYSTVSATLDPSESELSRLCTLLKIPPFTDFLAAFSASTKPGEIRRDLATRWIEHAISDIQPLGKMTLDHPGIFELVGLPRAFDSLTEAAVKRRCPTKPEKHVTDPIVCLFCGDIFCSQAACCQGEGELGGAGKHLAKCGGTIGLFISIRKCMVVFLHERHGSFAHAPYLDKHGEVDPSLRRHHQLFLSQRRYDKLLRDVWLSHGVPNVISRKLEGDINNGGWETL